MKRGRCGRRDNRRRRRCRHGRRTGRRHPIMHRGRMMRRERARRGTLRFHRVGIGGVRRPHMRGQRGGRAAMVMVHVMRGRGHQPTGRAVRHDIHLPVWRLSQGLRNPAKPHASQMMVVIHPRAPHASQGDLVRWLGLPFVPQLLQGRDVLLVRLHLHVTLEVALSREQLLTDSAGIERHLQVHLPTGPGWLVVRVRCHVLDEASLV
jgi:hypothetical protein